MPHIHAHAGKAIWFKGTKVACQEQAKRLRAEQGIQTATVVPLDQRRGAKSAVWAVCL